MLTPDEADLLWALSDRLEEEQFQGVEILRRLIADARARTIDEDFDTLTVERGLLTVLPAGWQVHPLRLIAPEYEI